MIFSSIRKWLRKKPGPRRLLILNPTSGHGRGLKQFDAIQPRLREMLGDYELIFTHGPGDATEFVREALKDREFKQILVAGGDGTIHEAMNGYFENGKSLSDDIPLGFINLGTGGDFYRTVRSMSPDYSVALHNNAYRLVDCGETTIEPMGFTRYFMNIASAGVAGLVLKNLKASRFQSGTPAFFYHTLRTLIQYRPARVRISYLDIEGNQQEFEEKIVNFFVCNGRFNGGGMKWAPFGNIEDGSFQVVCIKQTSKLRIVLDSRKVYGGQLAGVSGLTQFESSDVSIQPIDPISLELDGEIPPIESPKSIRFRNMHLKLPIVL